MNLSHYTKSCAFFRLLLITINSVKELFPNWFYQLKPEVVNKLWVTQVVDKSMDTRASESQDNKHFSHYNNTWSFYQYNNTWSDWLVLLFQTFMLCDKSDANSDKLQNECYINPSAPLRVETFPLTCSLNFYISTDSLAMRKWLLPSLLGLVFQQPRGLHPTVHKVLFVCIVIHSNNSHVFMWVNPLCGIILHVENMV